MSKHVFVSYSRREITFADSLTRHLEKAGFNVWIDYRDLIPGEDWNSQLFRAIETAEAVLLVVTHASVASPNVCKEWSCALSLGKRVILLLFEAVPRHEFDELYHSKPTATATDELSKFSILNWANSKALYEQEWVDFRNPFSASISELLRGLEGNRRSRGNIPETGIQLPPTPLWFLRLARPFALLGVVIFLFAVYVSIGLTTELILEGKQERTSQILICVLLLPFASVLAQLPSKIVRREHAFLPTATVLSLLSLITSPSWFEGAVLERLAGITIFIPSLTLLLLLFSPGMYRWANSERFYYTRRPHNRQQVDVVLSPVRYVLDCAPQDAPVAREISSQLQKAGHVQQTRLEDAALCFVLLSRFKKSTVLTIPHLEIIPLLLQDTYGIQKELQALQWIDFRRDVPRRAHVLAKLAGDSNALLQHLSMLPLRQRIMPQPVRLRCYYAYAAALMILISPVLLFQVRYSSLISVCTSFLCYILGKRVGERAITFADFKRLAFVVVMLGFGVNYIHPEEQILNCFGAGVLLMIVAAVYRSKEFRLWFPEKVRFDVIEDARYMVKHSFLEFSQISKHLFSNASGFNEDRGILSLRSVFAVIPNFFRRLLQI